MAAHKYWQALCMVAATPATLELSEFHLYSGVTRVDATATLTSSTAPTGALDNLKDDNTATGCYWASGGDSVVLGWEYAVEQEVTGLVLGARTTAARWPRALLLRGGDVMPGAGGTPEYFDTYAVQVPAFVSAAKTVVLPIQPLVRALPGVLGTGDVSIAGGAGYVPYVTETEILPTTDPKTYRKQWARVQLARFMDGRVVQEQWSNPVTGEGTFHGVDENFLYTVTAIYPDSDKRAVVADRLQPLLYPEAIWP